MIEGISFVFFIPYNKLGDIILCLSDYQKEDSKKITCAYSRVIGGPACEGVGHRDRQ